MENLERLESPEGCRDLVGFESIKENLVSGYYFMATHPALLSRNLIG